MELEDKEKGDVIEGKDRVDAWSFFSGSKINIIDEFNFIIWE